MDELRSCSNFVSNVVFLVTHRSGLKSMSGSSWDQFQITRALWHGNGNGICSLIFLILDDNDDNWVLCCFSLICLVVWRYLRWDAFLLTMVLKSGFLSYCSQLLYMIWLIRLHVAWMTRYRNSAYMYIQVNKYIQAKCTLFSYYWGVSLAWELICGSKKRGHMFELVLKREIIHVMPHRSSSRQNLIFASLTLTFLSTERSQWVQVHKRVQNSTIPLNKTSKCAHQWSLDIVTLIFLSNKQVFHICVHPLFFFLPCIYQHWLPRTIPCYLSSPNRLEGWGSTTRTLMPLRW